MTTQPALFISHGAPTLMLDDCPARAYLSHLGTALTRPAAIIVVSAHHIERGPAVTTDPRPETIHDFGGFPAALYRMNYSAPGDPSLATSIVKTLREAGFDAHGRPERGFDHGAWVPLAVMIPDADIPVVQVSIDARQSPRWHFRLGQALAPFRENGALIIGSGGTTHNLGAFFQGRFRLDTPRPDWVDAFARWITERIETGNTEAVLRAVDHGLEGRRNHPTPDHILPLFVALGAGHPNIAGTLLHASTTFGVLAMEMFGFGEPASVNRLIDPGIGETDTATVAESRLTSARSPHH